MYKIFLGKFLPSVSNLFQSTELFVSLHYTIKNVKNAGIIIPIIAIKRNKIILTVTYGVCTIERIFQQ